MSKTTLMKFTTFDDYPVVPTEEEESLGTSITSLQNNQFHFLKKSQKNADEFVQKCQSFASLIKTSPFQKGQKKPTPENFKLACSEAVISDVSTSSSLKKVESSPVQAQVLTGRSKRVSFSEEYNSPMNPKNRAGGILKLRNTRRYSQDQSDLYVIRPRAGSVDITKNDSEAENSELEINQSFDVSSNRESRHTKPRGAKRNSHGQSPKRNGSQSPSKGENAKSRFYRGSVQALGK